MFTTAPEYWEPKPPQGRPQGQLGLFYKQDFRLQCFIYAKYNLHRPKRRIQKHLFMKSGNTYLKYSKQAKLLIEEVFNKKGSNLI